MLYCTRKLFGSLQTAGGVHQNLFGPRVERGFGRKTLFMFRAIGFLIVLWGLSLYFGSSIKAFDRAATATFNTIEVAALVSQSQIERVSP